MSVLSDIDTAKLYIQFFLDQNNPKLNIRTINATYSSIKVLIYVNKTLSGAYESLKTKESPFV